MSKIKGGDLILTNFDPNRAIEWNLHLHQGNRNLDNVTLYKLSVEKVKHTNICLKNCVLRLKASLLIETLTTCRPGWSKF